MPFAGELTRLYATSLFSSSLSMILNAGLPLNQSFLIAKNLITNTHMKLSLDDSARMIEKGNGFAISLDHADVFPDMAIRMIAAGEEGGNLQIVLKEVARFYEREVEARLSVLTSVIEPALMVIMGFIIGFILLAMYLPIFQMAGTIGY